MISRETQIRKVLMRPLSYPLYPLAWLQYLTKDENISREQQQGTLVDSLDAIVSDPADPVTPMTADGVLPASDYPAAYTSILALDAENAINTPTTTSLISTPTQPSTVASATPSNALLIYRRDVCHEVCSSFALEYNITPGQSVDTCTLDADYTQDFDKDLAGDTKNYSISVAPFTSHGLTGCEYKGTNDNVGSVTCNIGFVPCSLPTSTQAVICGVATDTPIVYAEW